ncbi:MAG: hypothetical protein K2O04_07265 [Clostridiales bacterium]|nr:hypothetical protein [Clostridiales bacterium]
MSNIGCILWGINLLMNLQVRYRNISSDKERKANTWYFGAYSIVMSILFGGLFLLSVWGIIALIDAMDSAGIGVILVVVFLIMLALVALFIVAEYIFGGLLGVIYQFRCNRRPIAWIALVVFILTTAAMIAGLVFIVDITGV